MSSVERPPRSLREVVFVDGVRTPFGKAGWPFWLGGIAPYLDRAGVSGVVRGARFLPPGVASLPA